MVKASGARGRGHPAPQGFDPGRRTRTLTGMFYDPGFWLFGLAVGLLVLGILGVALSTRRVPSQESPGAAGSVTVPGSEASRLHALEAEVERLQAERDELRGILDRLALLLDRRPAERSAELRVDLATARATRGRGEPRPGGG